MYNYLHWAWIAHWVSYWTAGLLFPTAQIKTTTPVGRKKLVVNLIQNMLLTVTWPFLFINTPIYWSRTGCWYDTLQVYIILLLLSDATIYYTHRLLHHPRLYLIHKMHHTYIHAEPLAGLYFSGIEMILQNPLMSMTTYRMFDFSVLEIILWSTYFALHSSVTHSGVRHSIRPDTPFRRMLCFFLDDSFHASHHRRNNVNYGFFGFFDWLHGTYC